MAQANVDLETSDKSTIIDSIQLRLHTKDALKEKKWTVYRPQNSYQPRELSHS
jgi:hypothetical protein